MFTPSPKRIQQLASQVNIENEDVQKALMRILEDKANPKLEEIKQRAEDADSPQTARRQIEALPETEKDALFHETWAELLCGLAQLRIEPVAGLSNLKRMIRDPYTVEAMVLIFEVDEMPYETVQANKDLFSDYLNWIGCALAPEMYPRDDVEDFIETFGADPSLMDKGGPEESAEDD